MRLESREGFRDWFDLLLVHVPVYLRTEGNLILPIEITVRSGVDVPEPMVDHRQGVFVDDYPASLTGGSAIEECLSDIETMFDGSGVKDDIELSDQISCQWHVEVFDSLRTPCSYDINVS